MKSRWTIYLLIAFFALASLSLVVSAVTEAQSRQADDDDDEDAMDEARPSWVDLRVFIHRPRQVKPRNLGTCVPSTNPNVNDFDLAPWHLSGPIVWSLNRSTVPPSVSGSVDSVLNESASTWFNGVFSQGPDTRAKRARLDNVNAIMWKKLERSTVGVTFVWFSNLTGEVVEVDMVFNKRHPWAVFPDSPECQSSPVAYDLKNVATHEFGHWVGLEDLFDDADRDLTMYGFSAGGEVKKRTLGTGDISGRNALEP
jgi:hypothetical protein